MAITPLSEQSVLPAEWLELTSLPTSFQAVSDFDVSSGKWSSFTTGNGAAAISVAGANMVQVLFWGQKSQITDQNDADICIFARHLDGANATALHPVVVARATWADGNTLLRAPLPAPGLGAGVWYLSKNIDFSRPTGQTFWNAQNPFECTILQQTSPGAILQIPVRGWNELGIQTKTGALAAPTRLGVVYKLR